jgi:hypothetical protein
MSGYSADIISQHGVMEEGLHFLKKPFSMAQLSAKLRDALGDDEGQYPLDGLEGRVIS